VLPNRFSSDAGGNNANIPRRLPSGDHIRHARICSFGYGIGHDFDHKTCPQALEDFKALQDKYLAH
jgi:hypothetical protein